MLVQFFNHGTGRADSAIRYLLSDNDSNNNPRNPKPEIFYGDPDLTKILIDNNPRKFKYTSGVIAFRDSEKPTKRQLNQIIKSFYLTFAPGLGPERLNMLIVRHEDKGNTELHLLIPMIDAKTQMQFNIDPPGQYSTQMIKDFSALWNHKLGYSQVVEDPLKAEFSNFDKKSPSGKTSNTVKNRFSIEIPKLIRNGKINSRNELCEFLEEKGCTITRKGMDYISVRLPNQKKAIKLRGPVFSKNSDYKLLVQQADEVLNNTYLNDFQVSRIKIRLEDSTEFRRNFIENRLNKPKRMRKGTTIKPRPSIKKSKTPEIAAKPSGIIENSDILINNPTNSNNHKPNNLQTPKGGSKGSQNATISPSTKVMSNGATTSIKASLASVQTSIISALSDLTNAQTPEEKASIELKIAELRAQETKLQFELEQARISELNQVPISGKRKRLSP